MYDQEYIALYNHVKSFPPYNTWKSTGSNEIRNKENNLSLTPVGLKDWKTDSLQDNLMTIALELGIKPSEVHPNFENNNNFTAKPKENNKDPRENFKEEFKEELKKEKQKQEEQLNFVKEYYEKSYAHNTPEAKEVLAGYLSERGLTLDEYITTALKRMEVKVRKLEKNKEASYEILIPIYAIETKDNVTGRKIVKLQRVGLSRGLNKVYKKHLGSCKEDNATFFGAKEDKTRYVIEGFEDFLTIATARGKAEGNISGIITHGAGNFKKISSILDLIRKHAPTQEIKAILDNDKSNASLLASKELPKYVVRYMPDRMGVDANKAYNEGGFESWWNNLEVVTAKSTEYLDTIKEQKDSEVYTLHRDLIKSCFYDIKKDVVTGNTYCKTCASSEFERIEEKGNLNLIKSVGRDKKDKIDKENAFIKAMNKEAGKGQQQELKTNYVLQSFEEHLSFHSAHELTSELLIKVPVWDGRDRLREITDHIESDYYNGEEIYQIFREWVAKTWIRIYDPSVNQQFLALSGAQGAGKSEIVYALMHGYGRYSAQPDIPTGKGGTTKIARSLADLVIAFIDEFDKIPYDSQIILKDFITQQNMKFDIKWGVEDKRTVPKYSMIGCTNEEEPLRDSSGNRRYRIIPVTGIKLEKDVHGLVEERNNYPADLNDPQRDWNGRQLVAQYKAMAESGAYKVDPELAIKIKHHLADLTPEDRRDDIAHDWFEQIHVYIARQLKTGDQFDREHRTKWEWVRDHGVVSITDAKEVLDDIKKSSGFSQSFIYNSLKRAGIKDDKYKERGFPEAQHQRSQTRFLVTDPKLALEHFEAKTCTNLGKLEPFMDEESDQHGEDWEKLI